MVAAAFQLALPLRRTALTPSSTTSPSSTSSAFSPSPSLPRTARRKPCKIHPINCAPSSSSGTIDTVPTVSQTTATTAPPHPSPISTPTSYPAPAGRHAPVAALIRDAHTLPHFFHTLSNTISPSLPALVDPHHANAVTLTHPDLQLAVRRFSAGLRAATHTARGDVLALFAENSHRWLVADLAVMSAGAACAVRGTAAPPPELQYILQHSGSKGLIVENAAALRHLLSAYPDDAEGIQELAFVVVLFGSSLELQNTLQASGVSYNPEMKLLSYDELCRIGQSELDRDEQQQHEEFVGERTDMATLLYTSGTTGNPKGVPLSHDNILRQLEHISLGGSDPGEGDIVVSILPIWHVFERTASYWCISRGMTQVYSNKKHFKTDLLKYQPHLLIAVPRVFDSLHASITTKIKAASKLRKALFTFFSTVTLAFIHARRSINQLNIDPAINKQSRLLNALKMALLFPLWALAHALVWSKIRAGLGGRLRTVLSGGGSIALYLEDFFESAGLDIYVGYGMTETAPVIANRFMARNAKGTTGYPLRSTHIKLVDVHSDEHVTKPFESGVLFVKGPSVFSGYLNNDDATRKAFDHEGYYDTGDLAYYTADGDIVISGRKKDVIVLSNGENIEPTAIEDCLLASQYVDQILLVGQDERCLGAVVVPQLTELAELGVVSNDFKERVERGEDVESDDEVEPLTDFMKAEIKARNEERANYTANDKVVHVRVFFKPFTVENGMMTQTMKLKKDVIQKKYQQTIDAMFR